MDQNEKSPKLPNNKEENLEKDDQPSNSKNTNDNQKEASSSTGLSSKDNDGNTIDLLQRFMTETLRLGDDKVTEDPKKQVLEEVNVNGIIKYIKSGGCSNIIVMAGAGISTSAGIPDFRSPETGLYQKLAKYNLPYPQELFEIGFFRNNPKPFFAVAKEFFPGSYKPTPAHYFIRLLHEKGLLLRHYTQNVDGLEKLAGIPEEKIVEAHGTFYTSHCLSCSKEYTLDWMRDKIFADEIPHCIDCKGLIKPDIVFFGEKLPERFLSLVKNDFPKADLLIIMGSSLVVQPFASLIDRVNQNCPRILLNKEKAGQKNKLFSLFGMKRGLDFDSDKNYRDVAFLGDCDDLCRQLVEQLGWTKNYEKLIQSYA